MSSETEVNAPKKDSAATPVTASNLAVLRDQVTHYVKSAYFKDVRSPDQAMTKILLGKEYGIAPTTSLTSIHFFEGKPSPSAPLLAAMIRRSMIAVYEGRACVGYDYRPTTRTNDKAVVEFHRYIRQPNGTIEKEVLGVSTFTLEDAKVAGLLGKDNWRKYARSMLCWRAVAEGQKIFCPEIAMGWYLPDELGAETDEDGRPLSPDQTFGTPSDVIDAQFEVSRPASPSPTPAPEEDPERKSLGHQLAGLLKEANLTWTKLSSLMGNLDWKTASVADLQRALDLVKLRLDEKSQNSSSLPADSE